MLSQISAHVWVLSSQDIAEAMPGVLWFTVLACFTCRKLVTATKGSFSRREASPSASATCH